VSIIGDFLLAKKLLKADNDNTMQMSTFQIVVTGIFGILIVVGIGVFALSGGLRGGSSSVGTVVIWGTMDQNVIDKTLTALRQNDKSFDGVSYIQKDASTYESDLIDAMASGSGPDLFLLPQDDTTEFSNKISVIPYTAVSQATLTNSFIDESQLFLTSQGSLALPFTIDPLVMYWNRDLFSSAGIAQPPLYWSDILTLAPQLTVSSGSTVTQSGVALGEWSNIANAKAILSALFLQAGDSIISYDQSGAPQVALGDTPQGATENPATSALTFYTDFANPSKTSYTWNHSLPEAEDAFAGGTAAIYFGFADDNATLMAQNPNLHFGVAMLPQIKGNTIRLTYGELTGLAISRTTTNPTGALAIAEKLTSQVGIAALATVSPLPPVRNDVVIDTSANATAGVFDQSALIARGWFDPNPTSTDSIFQTMIESVVSGQNQPDEAVAQAAQSLSAVLHSSP
jgi:multiple sugar transport system substrate-binding protein